MAISHVQFDSRNQNPGVTHGLALRTALNQYEDGHTSLVRQRDAMIKMIDGDGSNANQFDEVVKRYGFEQTITISGTITAQQNAKMAWDEINAFLGKVTSDASQTFVNAARLQLFDKMR